MLCRCLPLTQLLFRCDVQPWVCIHANLCHHYMGAFKRFWCMMVLWTQESENGSWHVPTTTNDDLETPRQWLCATRPIKSWFMTMFNRDGLHPTYAGKYSCMNEHVYEEWIERFVLSISTVLYFSNRNHTSWNWGIIFQLTIFFCESYGFPCVIVGKWENSLFENENSLFNESMSSWPSDYVCFPLSNFSPVCGSY